MNDKKETVIDLATKQNCPELMQTIASHQGQQMIDRQIKIHDGLHNRQYDNRTQMTTVDGYRSS